MMKLPKISTKAQKLQKIPTQLQKYIDAPNIAEFLSDEELTKIAIGVIQKTEEDYQTTVEWRKTVNESLKIAKQIIEGKSFPWTSAANIKFPLMLNACIQLNSRVMPEVIQDNEVVKAVVMIPDPQGLEADRAERVSMHMSYQLLDEIENWQSDTDRLLMTLGMMGTVYRKSYFDSIEKRAQVDLCLPNDIIINNNISSINNADITHILHLSPNDLIERMRAGIFTSYELTELGDPESAEVSLQKSNDNLLDMTLEANYQTGKYVIQEQHTWLDLDDDNYKEPYIVTVHVASQKVLRIVARYDEESFVFNDASDKFIKIKPIQYFTDYHMLRSPDGTFLSLGYGVMLYPINATINSLLNQLVNAGTLSNLQCGFYSDELRVTPEKMQFAPGEFKKIHVPPGTRLEDLVYTLPVNPPQPALFQLLQLMIETGQQLGASSDVLMGQQPPANTPATTTMAMIEQGTKVYSSMLKRLYYSFQSEFKKLFELNKKYLDVEEQFFFAAKSGIVTLDDYRASDYGIFPVADPSLSSQAMRLMQSQALLQLAESPLINQYEVLKQYLITLKVPNLDKILPSDEDPTTPKPPPPPSPEDILAQAKADNIDADTQYKKMQSAEIMAKLDETAINLELKERDQIADAATRGANAVSQKVSSITQLAQMNAMVGAKQVATATKQVDQEEKETQAEMPDYSDLDKRIQQLEQSITSAFGGGQQGQGGQQGGGDQGQGAPGAQGAPGGDGNMPQNLPTGQVGTPPTVGTAMKPAEAMAPAQRAAEAEQAGEE